MNYNRDLSGTTAVTSQMFFGINEQRVRKMGNISTEERILKVNLEIVFCERDSMCWKIIAEMTRIR